MSMPPWAEDTPRSVVGRQQEKETAKRIGARLHPNSGAGKIKWDMSDEDTLIEHKTAGSSFTLSGKYILGLLKEAAKQGRDAGLIVYFDKLGITVTMKITRGAPGE